MEYYYVSLEGLIYYIYHLIFLSITFSCLLKKNETFNCADESKAMIM